MTANFGCFLAGVCGLLWSYTSHSEQVSHCDASVSFRCWNKWVGPLPLVVTAFEQSLQRMAVCLMSDSTKPNYWRDSAFLERTLCLLPYRCVWAATEQVEEKIDFHFLKSSNLRKSELIVLFPRPYFPGRLSSTTPQSLMLFFWKWKPPPQSAIPNILPPTSGWHGWIFLWVLRLLPLLKTR